MRSDMCAFGIRLAASLGEPLGNRAVNAATPNRTQSLQCHRTQLVVTEVVVRSVLTDDAASPELIEVLDELGFIDFRDRRHQVRRERPAKDGCDFDKLARAGSQLLQSSS